MSASNRITSSSSSAAWSSHSARAARTAGLLGALAATLLSSAALADDEGFLFTPPSPKTSAQAQVELLPTGSAKLSATGFNSQTTDTDTAYGISASFARDIHPNVSIGVAPRLILNVASDEDDSGDDSSTALDLRARVTAHFPVAPRMEAYASLSPGFTIIFPDEDDADSASGFAIGGAAGVTYEVSPTMFINGELGYQRAFTSTEIMSGGQDFDVDLDLSYLHLGLGAGTRF